MTTLGHYKIKEIMKTYKIYDQKENSIFWTLFSLVQTLDLKTVL